MAGHPNTYLIAVMGPTGVGKSTFINLASNSNMGVSNGLKSCTTAVTPTEPFKVQGRQVVLLDTPGFDDTNTGDFDILEEIAKYMTKTYKQKVLLDGILYFHNIALPRMGGIAVRNLRLFESLCGDDPLHSVIVVTNMWGLLQDPTLGEAREQELAGDPVFFGQILKGGASLRRHTDTKASSDGILSFLLDNGERRRELATLSIQIEMVDEKLRLDETTAAAELIKDFDVMIQNLKRRIVREQHEGIPESLRERKDRELAIKKMKTKISQLEERKVKIMKRSGSLWVHASFLRWVKSLFT